MHTLKIEHYRLLRMEEHISSRLVSNLSGNGIEAGEINILGFGNIKLPQDELDLTLEKYDICISIVVVNGSDTGKISVFHYAAYASMNVRVCPYF